MSLDLEQALLDPTAVFDSPESVLEAGTLTIEQKIEVLRRWAYDAREIAVAEEEGMIADQPSLLHRIQEALIELGFQPDLEHLPPTKQDGE
jgi:hypothetical protein